MSMMQPGPVDPYYYMGASMFDQQPVSFFISRTSKTMDWQDDLVAVSYVRSHVATSCQSFNTTKSTTILLYARSITRGIGTQKREWAGYNTWYVPKQDLFSIKASIDLYYDQHVN